MHQIAAFFAAHETRIHVGLWITMLASALVGPWAVVIAVQLKRIEGKHAPMSMLELACGAILILEFIFPLMIWQGADFRPLESPEITHRLSDVAWLMFVGVVSTGIVQAVAIAVPILRDRRADPIIPRWVAYTNLWCAVMFMPGGLIVFFKHGPFGWNGLVSWWMLLTAYWIWTIVNSYAMLRYAIPHQAREEDNADPELLTATTVPEAALPPPGWGSPSPSTP